MRRCHASSLTFRLSACLSACMFLSQIIKQCQVILNFLAAEGRLSTQHVDCIWAAAQVRHPDALKLSRNPLKKTCK